MIHEEPSPMIVEEADEAAKAPPSETAVPEEAAEISADRLSPTILWKNTVELAKQRRHVVTPVALAAVAIAGFTAFWMHHAAKPGTTGMMAIPVTVQTLTPRNVRLWSEFSGRLQAVDSAEIRPEVGGRITEVRFEDGQNVGKGDVLFVIDPAPYEAALAKAEANAAFAKTELQRADGLVKAQAIAQRQYDERANSSRVADADLARAQIDMDRAYVKAPISGRVGRPELTVGNVVQAGPAAPILTTIVSRNGIYADFEVDEQTYLQSIRDHASGRDQEREIPVELTVPGDAGHPYKGSIYSFDNHIDTVSGTIRARAKFQNRDGALLPGMFVTVRLGSSGETPALLVPERALGVDQDKKFVYVVGKDNKVAYREVTLGKEVAGSRVVLTGLAAGDRVIVDGVQHVRPDALADPHEDVPQTTPPNAPAASSITR
ncbi:MAG TPA: efflux RND transporter periplasmic adaptor subunit [Elusimicrobiota bacterium]|nr:efflux RND transporter periplasmic adaptor subunit [Elusimicrobiota bacterium]